MNTTTTYTDQRPTCCECGGRNVETTAWIDYDADGVAHIVAGEGPHDDETGNWCHDCQEHVYLDYPTTQPADDTRRQAANAAREHAAELLEALTDAAGRLDLVASDLRAGLLDHVGGDGATSDYEAGLRRCLTRAAELVTRLDGKA